MAFALVVGSALSGCGGGTSHEGAAGGDGGASARDVRVLLDESALPGHAVDLAVDGERILVAVGRAVVSLVEGQPPEVLCTLEEPILQLAVGSTRVFAITGRGPWPAVCSLGGGVAAPLLSTASADPVEVARGLLAEGDTVYWITVGSFGTRRLYRSAGEVPEEISSFHGEGDPGVMHLAMDAARVYWSDAATGTLHRASRDGGDSGWSLAPGINTTQIALQGASVLWAAGGSLHRTPKEGGTPEVVVGPQIDTDRIWALASDEESLFWGGIHLEESFIRLSSGGAGAPHEDIWREGDCWDGALEVSQGVVHWVCTLGKGAVYRAR
ncbi:hypothetical protein [Chondromyces crocatus]|uniref:hypothetical protein n=1 Tax=Chondromyces crocatus TaxID=52 RepID=UPI00067C502C|nr:hypothetical protein [Chondromyces crocatus]